MQQHGRREAVIVIDAEDPGLLVLVAQRRAQRAIEIRHRVRELAVERLEVRHAVLVAEDVIDLERPDVIRHLRRVDERVVVGERRAGGRRDRQG